MSYYKKWLKEEAVDLDHIGLCGIPPVKIVPMPEKGKELIDWGVEMLEVPHFWKFTQGKGIRVAVLDSGVAYNHPDLQDAIVDAKDFTNSPSGISDVCGHGTHCIGIIAARKDFRGVVGVAPLADIYSGKVVDDRGYGDIEMLIQGMEWAIEQRVHLISISLACKNLRPEVTDRMDAVIKKAIEQGIFIIAAAGNWGAAPHGVGYPARHPDVISVGAIDRHTRITAYSSRGEAVDIVAPGDQIISTYPPRDLACMSGTSMAVPFVTGVVALMLAQHKEENNSIKDVNDLREHLNKSAIDLGMIGRDHEYGFGLINAKQLLEASQYEQDKRNYDTEHLARQIQDSKKD